MKPYSSFFLQYDVVCRSAKAPSILAADHRHNITRCPKLAPTARATTHGSSSRPNTACTRLIAHHMHTHTHVSMVHTCKLCLPTLDHVVRAQGSQADCDARDEHRIVCHSSLVMYSLGHLRARNSTRARAAVSPMVCPYSLPNRAEAIGVKAPQEIPLHFWNQRRTLVHLHTAQISALLPL